MSKVSSYVVLLSGGQDSTTCLYWALEQVPATYHVRALCINYGQRHAYELDAAAEVAGMAGVRIDYIDLPEYVLESSSPLVNHDEKVEEYESARALPGGLEKTFVPMRNLLFLTLAANRARAWGMDRIVTGVSQEDFGGYPDCRARFIEAAEDAIQEALPAGERIMIDTPLITCTKVETVRMAMELPGCMDALAFSHTCYKGERPGCGKCHACLLRARGFEEAGVEDPLFARYAR